MTEGNQSLPHMPEKVWLLEEDMAFHAKVPPFAKDGFLVYVPEAKLLASEEKARVLEGRIRYILDDPEDVLYRNQAAAEIGYRASFPGRDENLIREALKVVE